MPDLGLDVLLKGNNMIRLLQGMWVALQISLISIVISMPLGILVGALMTMKNKIVRAIFRIYLEIIRIMPQLVLLFIVYFGSTRAFGWSLSGEVASIIVFVRLVPLAINLITRMIKTTSLVLMIGVVEMLKVAQQIIEANRMTSPNAAFGVFLVVFLLYFIACWPISMLARYLERKWG